ncbi:MAG: Smr/MutS family protein [Terriglobia bacterium]
MARQNFDRSNNAFELDLHGCSMEEGRSVAGHRIRECFRYGIEELRIIYGSADRAEGTLRQAVEEAIREASSCVAACSFRDSYGMFAAEKESTEVRVTLAPNSRPQAQDRKMVFVGFTSRYDTERHRHEPYYPLRPSGRG